MRASETSLFCCTATRPLNLHQSSIPTLTCCTQNTEANKRGKNLTQAFRGTKVILEPGGGGRGPFLASSVSFKTFQSAKWSTHSPTTDRASGRAASRTATRLCRGANKESARRARTGRHPPHVCLYRSPLHTLTQKFCSVHETFTAGFFCKWQLKGQNYQSRCFCCWRRLL